MCTEKIPIPFYLLIHSKISGPCPFLVHYECQMINDSKIAYSSNLKTQSIVPLFFHSRWDTLLRGENTRRTVTGDAWPSRAANAVHV